MNDIKKFKTMSIPKIKLKKRKFNFIGDSEDDYLEFIKNYVEYCDPEYFSVISFNNIEDDFFHIKLTNDLSNPELEVSAKYAINRIPIFLFRNDFWVSADGTMKSLTDVFRPDPTANSPKNTSNVIYRI